MNERKYIALTSFLLNNNNNNNQLCYTSKLKYCTFPDWRRTCPVLACVPKPTNSLGWTKVTNCLGKQHLDQLLIRMWSCHAPWNGGKFVKQTISLQFFYFELGGLTKHFNSDWTRRKQWVFSPDLSVPRDEAIEGFGETIVAVSLGTSH